MANLEYKDLLDAGVHFGHLTRKWDPQMAPYIFMEKNGIHIIDLNKTLVCLEEASKALKEESFTGLAKRERLMVTREKEKLERVLGGIADLTRLPAALFIVDIKREHIAVKEAQKLNIPVFAIVDTNSNPNEVDFPIPGNDDAYKSVKLILSYISEVIEEGLNERKREKDDAKSKEDEDEKRRVDEVEAVEESKD
mgnify:CR=1 FL=1